VDGPEQKDVEEEGHLPSIGLVDRGYLKSGDGLGEFSRRMKNWIMERKNRKENVDEKGLLELILSRKVPLDR
jgi:hypothetical protein